MEGKERKELNISTISFFLSIPREKDNLFSKLEISEPEVIIINQ
jgi:hypothetical protein